MDSDNQTLRIKPFRQVPVKALAIIGIIVVIVAVLVSALFFMRPKGAGEKTRNLFVIHERLTDYLAENDSTDRTAHRRFGAPGNARTGQYSDFMESVVQPVPGATTWHAELPEAHPMLEFTAGYFCVENTEPRRITLSVKISSDGEDEILYSRRIWARWPENNFVFFSERISLTQYAGQEVTLTFENQTHEPGDAAIEVLWGNPVIYSVEKTSLPNIVLICVDALRKDRIQCYNGESQLTPSLQNLADNGVVFRNAVSHSPWTIPSVISVLTGLTPSFHGAGKRIVLETDRSPESMAELRKKWGLVLPSGNRVYGISSLKPKIPTLLELLSAKYLTHFANGNSFLSAKVGVMHRFHSYADGAVHGHSLTEKAASWLEKRRDRLFFLYVHYMEPHEWITHHREKSGDEELKQRENAKGIYDELVYLGDAEVGRLINKLKELRLYDSSLIIFYSDHGELLWDSGTNLIGHGNSLRTQLIDVPLIVKFPHSEFAGKEIDDYVMLSDIFHTILEETQTDFEETILQNTVSLRDVVEDKTDRGERVIISENLLFDKELAAAQRGKYRLVYDIENNVSVLTEAGADRVIDPSGSLDAKNALEALKVTLENYLKLAKKVGGKPRLIRPSEEDLERLKKLGYLQ